MEFITVIYRIKSKPKMRFHSKLTQIIAGIVLKVKIKNTTIVEL